MNGEVETMSRVLLPLSVKESDGSVRGSARGGKTLRWKGTGEPPYLLYDFGEKVAGLLKIKSHRLNGPHLGVRYTYGPYPDFTPFEFIASFGDWQSEELSAFRFLKVTLSREFPCPAEVEIEGVSLIRTGYSLDRKRFFICDDPHLNAIWEAGVDTIQLCVQPNYLSGYASHYHPENRQWLKNWKSIYSVIPYTIWDGVRRDREAWLGDAYFGTFAWFYAGGDPSPVLNTFEIFSELQQSDGELVVSAFSRQKYLEYHMWFAPALDFFIQFTGDVKTAARYLNTFRQSENWLLSRIDKRYLLKVSNSDPRGQTWQYTIRRDGVITYLQAVLYKNLLSASFLEKIFGDEEKSLFYTRMAENVKKAINKHLWNNTGGYYETMIESEYKLDAVSQDSNVLCLLYGIADGDKTVRIRDFLKTKCWTPFGSATYDREIPKDMHGIFMNSNWVHNRQIWPYINVLEVEALFRAGFAEDSLELTKRCFGNMLERGPGTLWEMALARDGSSPIEPFFQDCYNSFCHSWGSYISYFLQAYVAGIRPLESGFSKVLIAPCLCGLKEVNACVPAPLGKVIVATKRKRDRVIVDINLTDEVKWEFDGRMLEGEEVTLIVNGKKQGSI